MARLSFMTFCVTLIAALLTTGPSHGAQESTGDLLKQFEQSIDEYMALRHAVEPAAWHGFRLDLIRRNSRD
jgi:hypothetical protein